MKEVAFDEQEPTTEWAENFHVWFFRGKILLKKYWWIFLPTLSLGLGYQAYEENQREPRYVSQGKMIVDSQVSLPRKDIIQDTLIHFWGTQSELMRSPIVQNRARERVAALRPELKPIPVQLGVGQQPDTAIFILRAEGGEPIYTQAFLDACMDSYINYKKETRTNTSDKVLLQINEKLMVLEDEIDQQETALVEFQKVNNLVFVKGQGVSAGSNLVKLTADMADLRTKYRMLETLSLDQYLNRGIGSEDETAGGDLVSRNVQELSPEYRAQKVRYDQLVAERDEFSIYMKPRHPKIMSLNREIERTNNYLKIYQRQGLEKLESQKRVLKIQIENLATLISEVELTALDYSRRQAEYERLESQLQRSRNLYDNLLETIQNLDLNENFSQETIAVFEHAGPANTIPVQIGRNFAQGGVAGMALGFGLIFLLGILDSRIISGEDLTRRFELPIMGIIPYQKQSKKSRMELLKPKDTRYLFAEACRTLRSSILFMDKEGVQPTSFVVTSAVPSEGKSTISSNLAITLALTSSKTILVDADLRRGALHKQFGLSKTKGLSEIILEDLPLADSIQKTGIENLDFISTGEYPERPGELLLSERMSQICNELHERYEYVIFDSAPILATEDTPSFATRVDGVLFTVRSGYTQARQVRSSHERLMQRGVRVCGFILNFVDIKGSDYYYYNKYQNYYYVEEGGQTPIQKV